MDLLRTLGPQATAILLTAVAIGLCALVESRWPARPAARDHRSVNMALGVIGILLGIIISPLLAVLTTLTVNAAGGGLITLPSRGWKVLISIAVFALAMDFGEYVFHRTQHAFPLLWRMHSLHHSDPHYNSTTALRNFWAEPFIKSVTIWLAVGLVFKATPLTIMCYGILTFYNLIIHTNTRLHFGWLSWALNAPAYHRIHHSALSDHADCNYAAIFPIFDVISGAYRPPRRGMYPPTGLALEPKSVSLFQALIWPLAEMTQNSSNRMTSDSIG